MQVPPRREAVDVRPRREACPLPADGEVARQHRVTECDAKGREEVVERRHVGAARGGGPPTARVVVEEAHAAHRPDVVPVGKNDETEAENCDVRVELLDLQAQRREEGGEQREGLNVECVHVWHWLHEDSVVLGTDAKSQARKGDIRERQDDQILMI